MTGTLRNDWSVTTTADEVFTVKDTVRLAALIYKRFGYDAKSATAAWRRLHENNCSESDFVCIAKLAERTNFSA
jgi:hypothetical protein